MGHSKNSSKREVYSNTILPQETRKISNKHPNFIPIATRERRTNTAQRFLLTFFSTIRAEINKIEIKKN